MTTRVMIMPIPTTKCKSNDYYETITMIPTTTWTEQSFCLSSKDVASSSREMIQVFSGNEITVARPGEDDRI